MKRTSKVALCGIVSAISIVIMMLAYFPYLTYAVPAIAGLTMAIVVIEINPKWAFLTFLSSAVLIMLFAEPEAKIMYIGFFGYYPILKERIERINKPIVEYIIKHIFFNVVMISIFYILINMMGVPVFDDAKGFDLIFLIIFLALGNITFFIYDLAITRVLGVYLNILHPRLKKLKR